MYNTSEPNNDHHKNFVAKVRQSPVNVLSQSVCCVPFPI